jgi:hypothetical protein
MTTMLDTVYVVVALALQAILIIYFALRRWRAAFAFRIGRAIYALGVPLAVYAVVMVFVGQPWYLWVGGLLYALWALLGSKVDTGRPLLWHEPICPRPFNGYVLLYLVYQMFFWWPLGGIWRPGWYIFAALFVLATYLNVISRKAPEAGPVLSH